MSQASIVTAAAQPEGAVTAIALVRIRPNPHQPRRSFSEASILALADSLQRQGLVHPIIVRPAGPAGDFELVSGERRLRAAERLGWPTIAAIVRAYSDRQSVEIALVENELREAVSPIDTAFAVARLIDAYDCTHEDVGYLLGIDRSSVTNLLRLLTLDPQVQRLVGPGEGRLSAGHAKALLALPKPQQRVLAQRAAREQLSVRQLEAAIRRLKDQNAAARAPAPAKDPNLAALERALSEHLGEPVEIDPAGEGRAGQLIIRFHSDEELEGLLERLGYRSI